MRNDECEEGSNRLIGSGEHARHRRRSAAESNSPSVTPFRAMNGSLIEGYGETYILTSLTISFADNSSGCKTNRCSSSLGGNVFWKSNSQ